ncbi:transposase, partial [Thiolapillus sp.]|uniref:transposase n=1 Tax=Thiolapillus sp. TaxID=2017437 RepID=UPI0034D57B0F
MSQNLSRGRRHACKKRHDYVTIVSDQEAGTVLFVGEDRKKATLKAWYESLTEA